MTGDRSTLAPGSPVPGRARLWVAIVLALTLAPAALVVSGRPAHALDPERKLTQYFHRIWQVQQGLPQAAVRSVCQARDGYIWLGTEGGLVRFDGVRFTPLEEYGGERIGGIRVRHLLEDRHGALWVATDGAGLLRLRGGAVDRFSLERGLPSGSVHSLVSDPRGAVWACTAGGIARVGEGGRVAVFRTAQGLASDDVRAACVTAGGALWAGGAGTVLSVREGEGVTFTPRPLTTLPSYAVVLAMLSSADGSIWVGTTSGLVRLKDGREDRFTRASGLADGWILSLSESGDGSLWVGTREGWSRIRGGEIESFRASDGLSQSTVYSLCMDHEGSLWVGTKNGLNQFLDRRMVPFTHSEGLPSNETGPVLQDRSGDLWVGTLDAGVSRFDGDRFHPLTAAAGLASDRVHALAAEGVGEGRSVWVGTERGLNRVRAGRVEATFTTADGLPSDFVRCVLRDRRGELWVGTNAGAAVLREGRFLEPRGPDGPMRAPVLAMIERRSGEIALAVRSGGGLYACADGRLRPMLPEGDPPRDVAALFEDADGLLWLGTLGGGLLLVDEGGKVRAFSTRDGLFDEDVYGIAADGFDRLWLACSKGICAIPRSDLLGFARGEKARFESTPFSPMDALRTIECRSGVQPSICRLASGNLWFSTMRGVMEIDPARLPRPPLPPSPVVIEEVIVNGRVEAPAAIEELRPGIKNLELRFSALSFVAPERTTFRHRLEGFDADWVDAGTRRTAFYTNLPPGRFVFRVAARGIDGSVTEAAPLAFALAPQLYQRGWFIPLCAGAGALVVWLVVRLRIRRLREHLDAVHGERTRIARELHDTLLQGFSGVTMEMQALAARLPPSGERSGLEEIIGDAGACMRDARRSVAGLRSAPGADEGLAAAIARSAEHAASAAGMALRLDLDEAGAPLPPGTEYDLLRIAQEAVSNAARHSGASAIEVALRRTPGLVLLTVRDDGAGIAQAAAASGGDADGRERFGLVGMRERASEIGASLEIESERGRGTVVRVRLDLDREGGAASSRGAAAGEGEA